MRQLAEEPDPRGHAPVFGQPFQPGPLWPVAGDQQLPAGQVNKRLDRSVVPFAFDQAADRDDDTTFYAEVLALTRRVLRLKHAEIHPVTQNGDLCEGNAQRTDRVTQTVADRYDGVSVASCVLD